MSPHVRTVKTSSGATAVQIVYSSRRRMAAHGGAEVELLKAAARQRLAAGQDECDLGLDAGPPPARMSPRMAQRSPFAVKR